MSSNICSMPGCEKEQRTGQRYCPECHKRYMRAWRAKKKLEHEALLKEVIELRKRINAGTQART